MRPPGTLHRKAKGNLGRLVKAERSSSASAKDRGRAGLGEERSTAGSKKDPRKRISRDESAQTTETLETGRNRSPRKDDRAVGYGNVTERNGLHHGSRP
jgi:hypothetical protein